MMVFPTQARTIRRVAMNESLQDDDRIPETPLAGDESIRTANFVKPTGREKRVRTDHDKPDLWQLCTEPRRVVAANPSR